jgi:lactate dehydrogenase-like 2-hydroxyacid dehydrogenase
MSACSSDCVCLFVNDQANEAVLEVLASQGVKLILLRNAGFNNVDLDVAAKVACNFHSHEKNSSPQASSMLPLIFPKSTQISSSHSPPSHPPRLERSDILFSRCETTTFPLQHGMSVRRVPAYSPYAVAEMAVALMLAVVRKIPKAYNRVRCVRSCPSINNPEPCGSNTIEISGPQFKVPRAGSTTFPSPDWKGSTFAER